MQASALSCAAASTTSLRLLVCVDAGSCQTQLNHLVQTLEKSGCMPAVWHVDKTLQAPLGISPKLALVAAVAHAAGELRLIQLLNCLRQSFSVPVLMLSSFFDVTARNAPLAGRFDGVLPGPGDAQFFSQLHLWLRLQDAEARAQAADWRLTTQLGASAQVFGQLPFGVLLAQNSSGTLCYQNGAAAQICGMAMPRIDSFEDYCQFGALGADGASLPAEHYPLVRSLTAGEVIVDELVRLRRKDGRVVQLNMHSTPVRDSVGMITGAMCIFREVLAAGVSAVSQPNTSVRLQQIVDASASHAIVVDTLGRYRFANRAHCLWTKCSELRLLGQPLAEQLKHSDYPLVQCALSEALAGVPAALEHVLTDVDGAKRHFLIRWEPLHQQEKGAQQIVGAIGYFVDIDALRQVEMQVAQREMRFTLMSECLPIKVFTTDVLGGLTYLNASWLDYIGHTWESSLGHGWTNFVHPEDLVRIQASQAEYAQALGGIDIEYRLRRHDGVYRWHRARCMPLPIVSQSCQGREWVGVVVDIDGEITAQQKAEQRVRETQAESQSALAAAGQAQEQVGMLQAERQAREQFVATLSHDLRTPLTAARMGIERLQQALQANPKLARIASRVARSISRTDVMLEDFLDVSRVCAGRPLLLTRTWQSLRDIVEATLHELDPLHAARCCLAASEPGQGAWDASSVQRVVDNLVGNALKYGERQTPITLKVAEGDEQVVLSVHNQGEPIAPEDQRRLFDHFDRLDSAAAAGERGWGIGLTLVACIARAYGGSVDVSSAAGVGTTFFVTLPRGSKLAPAVV